MIRRTYQGLLAASLTALVLCVVVDSRIVRAAEEQEASVKRWTLVPTLRIGSVDGERDALSIVTSVATDGAGRIYVGQPQESSVRVFSNTGKALVVIGRAGDGPGESRGVGRVGVHGDTVVVISTDRINLFNAAGGALSTTVVPRVRIEPSGVRYRVAAVLRSGRIVRQPTYDIESAIDGRVSNVSAVLTDAKGLVIDTVATWSVRDVFYAVGEDERKLVTNRAVVGLPVFGYASNGAGYAVIEMEPSNAERARYRLRLFDGDGGAMFDRQMAETPVRIPAAVRDSILDSRAKRAVQPGSRTRDERRSTCETTVGV